MGWWMCDNPDTDLIYIERSSLFIFLLYGFDGQVSQGRFHPEVGWKHVYGLSPAVSLVGRQRCLIEILGLGSPILGVVVSVPCCLGIIRILRFEVGVDHMTGFD